MSSLDDSVIAKNSPIKFPSPYQWLEDPESDTSRGFVEAQNSQFQDFIQDPKLNRPQGIFQPALSKRHALPTLISVPRAAGDYLYFRVAGQGTFSVHYRIPKSKLLEGYESNVDSLSQVEVFHDEANDGGVVVSSGFSKCGEFWAYSGSIGGYVWCTIHIKDTTTGQLLPDVLIDSKLSTRESDISWLGNTGFFYQFWTGRENSRGPQLRFHRVGTKQFDDILVFEDTSNEELTFAAEVLSNCDFVLLSILRAGKRHKLWAARLREFSSLFDTSTELNLSFDFKISDEFDAEWR